jgi:hypothetical protein
MYIAKTFVRRADGSKRYYFVLRHTIWDKTQKRPVQKYIAYLGVQPIITLERAQQIAQESGLTIDDLRRVRGLTIVSDDNVVHTPWGDVGKS